MTQGVQDVGQDILNYGNTDPYSYVAPLSANQQQANTQAANLGGWQNYLTGAGELASNVAGAGPNLATTSFAAPSLFGAAQVGPAAQAGSVGAQAAQLNPAAQMTAAQLGTAHQAAAGQAGNVSLLDNGLDRYQNPFTNDVVNSSLANFDDTAGRAQATQAAQAARTGAFGGSRNAITQAQLMSDQTRQRADLEATLRASGFDRATDLAQSDAALRQGTSLFNAGETGTTNRFNAGESNVNDRTNAGYQQDASGRNIDALNAANIAQGGYTTQANVASANNAQSAALANAAATNQGAQFNAGNQQQAAHDNAANLQQASLFNAGAANQGAQFNAGQMDQQQQNQLAAANLGLNIGNSLDQNQIADIQSLLATGQVTQDQVQAYLNAPATQVANQAQMYGSLPLSLFSGQNTTAHSTGSGTQTGPGLLQSILGAGATLGAAAITHSDRRLKRDIVKIGEFADGLGRYVWTYIWGGPRREGVMADEIARLRPWALGPEIGGFATVDYSKLEAV